MLTQAIDSAVAMVGVAGYSGMCEQFVRTRYGFPAMYSSARLAWEDAGGKHYGDMNPPAGVPVFWDITYGTNAPYDHVALSVGNGEVVSTSAGKGKTIARVSIKELTKAWGMEYLGWAEVYHRVRIWEPPKETPAPSPAPTEEDDMFEVADRAKLDKTAYAVDQIILPTLTTIATRVWKLSQTAGADQVDEDKLAALILAGMSPEKIAQAVADLLPAANVQEVADYLADTLAKRLAD